MTIPQVKKEMPLKMFDANQTVFSPTHTNVSYIHAVTLITGGKIVIFSIDIPGKQNCRKQNCCQQSI